MKIFQRIYDWCIKLSKHRLATFFLCINSFVESIFWPIPPDAMLIPMCLARPKQSLRLAGYTTLSSIIGAAIGFMVGYYLWDICIHDWFIQLHWMKYVDIIKDWFMKFGILFVAIGAFTPIPYKVIAITTGMMAATNNVALISLDSQLSIAAFLVVSLIGRGARFYIEAIVIKLGGEPMADKIRKYIDIIGWICVLLVVIGLVAYYLNN